MHFQKEKWPIASQSGMFQVLLFLLLPSATFTEVVRVTAKRHGNMHERMRLAKRDAAVNQLLHSKHALFLVRPLTSYKWKFVGQLGIGTPPQFFDFMFDTGSFQTWVSSIKCTTPSCQERKFDGSLSSTYIDTKVEAEKVGTMITLRSNTLMALFLEAFLQKMSLVLPIWLFLIFSIWSKAWQVVTTLRESSVSPS